MGWKIIDEERAKKLGISTCKPDDDGYLMISLSSIPAGMGIEEFVKHIQKEHIVWINKIEEK